MILLSINTCNIINKENRRHISDVCSRMGVSFLGMEETHISTVDLFLLKSIWGNLSLDFVGCSARGFSGASFRFGTLQFFQR